MGQEKFDPDVVRAHQEYVDAINSNNVDRVMECYDKDAEIMQPNGPLVSGHDDIRKWVADYFAQFKTHWDKKSVLIWVAGDYGFDQGVDTATEIPYGGGPVEHYTVKGILIYKRQTDGQFKVYRDIWNRNDDPKVPPTGK